MTSVDLSSMYFKMAAAEAMAKYKSAQAHTIFQLLRKDLNFDQSARATVMIEFEELEKSLMRAEESLGRVERRVTTDVLALVALDLCATLDRIHEQLDKYVNEFDRCVSGFVRTIHAYSVIIIKTEIPKLAGTYNTEAFIGVARIARFYMQHLLSAMHEFTNNIANRSKSPFLSVCSFSVKTAESAGEVYWQPCFDRANFFKNNGVKAEFILKDYTEQDVFDEVQEAVGSEIHLIREKIDTLIPA